jgi:hypothetical protein
MNRFLSLLAALSFSAAPAMADPVSVLVFDASGSMWNRVEGDLTRIEVARDVMGDYFASRDGTAPLSVIAYGHNRRGDCRDIEVVAPMGTAAADMEGRLRALMPRGMTPLTDSLALAREQIPPTAESADIILVTDGLENCEGDPCALAGRLAGEGIDIRAHVVGFGLTRKEVEALSCITDQTGGMLFQTNSGRELAEALQQVTAAAPSPPAPPPAEETAPALLEHHFVFRDVGTGTPRGLMDWRAEAPDGSIVALGTTEGTQQSLEGIQGALPPGEWTIIAEGAEGRAERAMTLTQCCGSHGIPFTGTEMVAVIPPIGEVQAGMAARIPYEITHPGTSNLGGTPYKVIATGPEGSLSRDQIVRDDLITKRDGGMRGGATGELRPGSYRLMIVVARSGAYDIIAERSFEAVEEPAVRIVGPDVALPGERIDLSLDGGYATRYVFAVVDQDDRPIGREAALYQGVGGALSLSLQMPDREGVFDIIVRRGAGSDEILARHPITVGASVDKAEAQDALPSVSATFRLPPDTPQSDVTWEAVPLDPDMSAEAWAPMETGPVVSGTFEPGNWRVTAHPAGQPSLSADVEIFPGQGNDFVVSGDLEPESDAPSPAGLWQVIGVPPYQVQAGADQLLTLNLEGSSAGADGLVGTWTAKEMLAGPQANGREGDFTEVEQDGEVLRLTFTPGEPIAGSMTLFLTPYAAGYAGSLSSGGMGISVVMWPAGVTPPSLAEMRAAVHGPAPDDFVDLTAPATTTPGDSGQVAEMEASDNAIAFACTGTPSGCTVSHEASGISLTLPNGWSMSEPYRLETAAGVQGDLPTTSFFAEDLGRILRIELNPRQWLSSNGSCQTVGQSELCTFAGQGMAADIAFGMIAASISLADTSESDPPAPGTDATGAIRLTFRPSEQFGACRLNAELANPTGESFTLLAEVQASIDGVAVQSVLDPGSPAMLEVTAYAATGAALTPPTMMGACSRLVVSVGPARCRMGVGHSGPVTDCPAPVEALADPEFLDLFMIGDADRAAAAAPPPVAAGGSAGTIPIDLGSRDPATVLRNLFGD